MRHSPPAPPLRLASRPRRRRSIAGLTSLIDVVFILLVFFMVASSFAQWRGIVLNAPEPTGGESAPAEGALLVELRTDGLRLSGEAVSLDALGASVNERLANRERRRVLLKAADGVPLQRAVEVLDRLHAAGIADVSLIEGGAEAAMRFAPRLRPNGDEERLLPLINVVFLLLLFFVVAGRLSASDPFKVEPPRSASEGTPRLDAALITLGEDGRLALDGAVMEEEALVAALSARRDNGGALPELRLKADGAAAATRVVALLSRLSEAGVERLTLLTVHPAAPR
jgi:biopolymer transport protein ExbD